MVTSVFGERDLLHSIQCSGGYTVHIPGPAICLHRLRGAMNDHRRLLVAIAVLLGLSIYLLEGERKHASPPGSHQGTNEGWQDSVEPPVQPLQQKPPIVEPLPVLTTGSQFKIVKIVTSLPKTLEYLPGQLIIVSDGEKLHVRNLSETNPTWMNGLEIKPGNFQNSSLG